MPCFLLFVLLAPQEDLFLDFAPVAVWTCLGVDVLPLPPHLEQFLEPNAPSTFPLSLHAGQGLPTTFMKSPRNPKRCKEPLQKPHQKQTGRKTVCFLQLYLSRYACSGLAQARVVLLYAGLHFCQVVGFMERQAQERGRGGLDGG